MRQLTLRVSDELATRLRRAAELSGRSVNSFAGAVLTAAVDPELAGNEAERTRERLASAGLLETTTATGRRPEAGEVEAARARAGRGRPLSELVSEDRR